MRHFLYSTFSVCAAGLALAVSVQCIGVSAAEGGMEKLQVVYADRFFGQIHESEILKRCVRFEMGPEWWQRMNADDRVGTRSLQYVLDGIRDFGKAMSWGDVRSIEDGSSGSKQEKKARIGSMLDGWTGKVSVTLKAESPDCDSKDFDLAMRYFTALGQVLDSGDFKPKGGKAHITLLISRTAKDISVSSKDGENFTLVGPISKEPDDWGSKIDDGFERLSIN